MPFQCWILVSITKASPFQSPGGPKLLIKLHGKSVALRGWNQSVGGKVGWLRVSEHGAAGAIIRAGEGWTRNKTHFSRHNIAYRKWSNVQPGWLLIYNSGECVCVPNSCPAQTTLTKPLRSEWLVGILLANAMLSISPHLCHETCFARILRGEEYFCCKGRREG